MSSPLNCVPIGQVEAMHKVLLVGEPAQEIQQGKSTRQSHFEGRASFGYLHNAAKGRRRDPRQPDVAEVASPAERCSRIARSAPGARVQLCLGSTASSLQVRVVIDPIQAEGIRPSEVSPECWSVDHRRLWMGVELRSFTSDAHAAFARSQRLRR